MPGFARSPLGTLALGIALVGSAMCTGDNIIGPQNQLLIDNATNNFQFKISNLANVTQSLSYNWANTGDSASIYQVASVIGGTASVTIRAPSGTVVYQSDLASNGTFPSMKGAAGTWQILFAFSKADGNVTLQALKVP